MSDFFGGIFDSLRGLVSSADELFDTVLDDIDFQAIEKSILDVSQQQRSITSPRSIRANIPSTSGAKAGKVGQMRIADPLDFQRMWMERLRDFSNIEKVVSRTKTKV